MKIIALDSSGLTAGVAILEDGITLAEYTLDYKKTHSQTLLPMLDEITRMTESDPASFDAIAIAAGPGSFTGLRIGSATAKGLGLALGIPLIEVPTLAGLAWNVWGASGIVCPVMDARRNQVYNGLYRFSEGELVTLRDQRAVSVEELAEELNALAGGESVILLGDGVVPYGDQFARLLTVPYLIAPAHANRQRASSVGALGMRLFRDGRSVDADRHVPVYLRKSQAEREREEQKRSGSTPQDPFSRAAAHGAAGQAAT